MPELLANEWISVYDVVKKQDKIKPDSPLWFMTVVTAAIVGDDFIAPTYSADWSKSMCLKRYNTSHEFTILSPIRGHSARRRATGDAEKFATRVWLACVRVRMDRARERTRGRRVHQTPLCINESDRIQLLRHTSRTRARPAQLC